MDTRLSVAIHVLVLISEADIRMSSEAIAASAGVNASYIRKIMQGLKKSGLITSSQGKQGFTLAKKPDKISLYEIYKAVNGEETKIFDIHRNPNDRCVVGKHIQPVLEDTFASVEADFSESLSKLFLSDCISKIRERL